MGNRMLLRRTSLLLCLAPLLTACHDPFDLYGCTTLQEVVSPNGQHIATLSRCDAGATGGELHQVTLRLAKEASLPEKEDCVYSAPGYLDGHIQWETDEELTLICLSQSNPQTTLAEEWGDVDFTVEYQCPRPITHSVPVGFSGPVVCVFGVDGGVKLPAGWTVVCSVSSTGVLLISESYPGSISELSFALRYSDGPDRPLYQSEGSAPDELQVVGFREGTYAGHYYHAFLIASRSEVVDAASQVQAAVVRAFDGLRDGDQR